MSTKHKFNLLFFGNDEISLPSLAKIYEEFHKDDSILKEIGVITTPAESKRSGQSIFHKFLDEKKIEKFQLSIKTEDNLKNSWRQAINMIKEKEYNIAIIASFGKMLPGNLISQFRYGAFVMHPSLLPKYRGAAPIQHAILNREKKTGVSIVEASVGKFDAGNIITQKEIEILNFHRFKELSLILSHMGADLVIELLNNYEELTLKKTPQDETLVTQAKLIKDSTYSYLDFCKQPADEIIKLYKALCGSQLDPYAHFDIEGKQKFLFFDNLFLVKESSELYKLNLASIADIAVPGAIYWDLKINRENIFFKSTTDWLVSTKIKLDGTAFEPADKIITKFMANKRFNDTLNSGSRGKKFAFITKQKKIQTIKL